jgi:hypothetical protein
MKFKKTAFSIVFASILVVACIRVSAPLKHIEPDTPTLGNLNGVSMAIPRKHQFFPVEYEGDDIWNSEWLKTNSSRVPTQDMKIRTFSLLLHLPDYAPLNFENEKSWRIDKTHYGFNQDWITVGISSNNHGACLEQKDWFKKYVERVKAGNSKFASAVWHYEIADENIYGLRHEVLVGPTSTKVEFMEQQSHKEFYSDTQNWSTKIECQRMFVAPFLETSCEQRLIIPELDSFITIEYNPKHIKDWREMQAKVISIIYGFEVRNAKSNKTRTTYLDSRAAYAVVKLANPVWANPIDTSSHPMTDAAWSIDLVDGAEERCELGSGEAAENGGISMNTVYAIWMPHQTPEKKGLHISSQIK